MADGAQRTVRVRVITYLHPDGTHRVGIRGERITIADPEGFDRAEIAAGYPPLPGGQGVVDGGTGERVGRVGSARKRPQRRGN